MPVSLHCRRNALAAPTRVCEGRGGKDAAASVGVCSCGRRQDAAGLAKARRAPWARLKIEENAGLPGIRAAAEICADQVLFVQALETFGHETYTAAVEHEKTTLPALDQFDDPSHETVLWRDLLQSSGSASVADGLRMLTALVARHGSAQNCYAPLNLPSDKLAIYPLTLDSLRRHSNSSWPGLSAREWLGSLLVTVLSTHQQVAFRKFGQSGQDTLMFRHGDGGLEVERLMAKIATTGPRLKQAFQILQDLGLVGPSDTGDLPVPTADGLTTLNAIRHG